jgi:lipopolysaccharide export system protein LptA
MYLKSLFLFFKMFLVCTLALFALSTASSTETPNRKAVPIHIKANRLDSYNKENKIIFTGDVIAKKAELTIYADQMTVFYRKAEGKEAGQGEGADQVEKIFANGHVKITKGKRIATGDEAVYYEAGQDVSLTGNPKVWEGNSMIKGSKITVFLDEDRSIVESQEGNRVEAIVYPEK